MTDFELKLPPKRRGGANENLTTSGPIVIVGANGSGKSRMGAWIEENHPNPDLAHRISAQKSLDFEENVKLFPLEQSERYWYLGSRTVTAANYGGVVQARHHNRWQRGNRPALSVTPMLTDYDAVLSNLFARRRERDRPLAAMMRESQHSGHVPAVPESPDETLLGMWSELLPHRKLQFDSEKVTVSFELGQYAGREMSDGERVILYLLAQSLLVKNGTTVIVDEPELHVHRSLINRLWTAIETARPQCLFVYITQDLDFAASRTGATKIWVKSYDGTAWEWEEIPRTVDLPEAVVIEILGTRKPILFTEGERGGLDHTLYALLYPESSIVPRGGCEQVIVSTRALRQTPGLHHIDARGLIDRDFRPDEEITALQSNGILVLSVAEVENLLCTPELVKAIGERLYLTDALQRAETLILKELSNEAKVQAFKRTLAEVQFRLNGFAATGESDTDMMDALGKHTAGIDIAAIYNDNLTLYRTIIQDSDYAAALRVFNRKGLFKQIAGALGIKFDLYLQLATELLKEDRALATKVRYWP